MGDDEARSREGVLVLGRGAIGRGVGDVCAGVTRGVAPRQRILVGDAADVQRGHHGGGGGGGHADALVVRDRKARLFGGAARTVGTRGVDDAIGDGVAVIVTAHVDVGIHEPPIGQEQCQGCVGMVADTVVDHVVPSRRPLFFFATSEERKIFCIVVRFSFRGCLSKS